MPPDLGGRPLNGQMPSETDLSLLESDNLSCHTNKVYCAFCSKSLATMASEIFIFKNWTELFWATLYISKHDVNIEEAAEPLLNP